MNAIEKHDPRVIEAVNDEIQTIKVCWSLILNRLAVRKHPGEVQLILVMEEQGPA
jgi:hypothetical protein